VCFIQKANALSNLTDVSFVYPQRLHPHNTAFPLRVFSKQLLEIGIRIHFFDRLYDPSILNSQILCITYGDRYLLIKEENKFEYFIKALEYYRSKGLKVIIIDDHDTTGGLNSTVIDSVDIYAKAQLLSDVSKYTVPHYDNIHFKQYYHETFGLSNDKVKPSNPLNQSQIDKLRLSWNYGMIDWGVLYARGLMVRFQIRYPRAKYKLNIVDKHLKERQFAISLRVGLHAKDNIVNHHRTLALNGIKQFESKYSVAYGSKLSYSDYQLELADTMITPSPYGLGEICYRDFEAFQAKSVLLKPTMEDIQTWPNYFRDQETYVSCALDYSDYQEKIQYILDNLSMHQDIATEGQQKWRNSLNDGENFASHFKNIVS
jgi:hypothetical protein